MKLQWPTYPSLKSRRRSQPMRAPRRRRSPRLAGGPALGARDALSADADPAVQFDGVDDELVAGTAATAVTDCGS